MYNNDFHGQSFYPYSYVPWLDHQPTPYVPEPYYPPSVCLDHLKGICTDKRVRCKFAHPPLPSQAPIPTPISDNHICSVYVLTGFCKFGAKCRYYHPISAEGTAVCAPAITTKMIAFLAKQGCWTPDHSDSEGISDCGESVDATNASDCGECNLVVTTSSTSSLLNTSANCSNDAVESLVRKVTGILNRLTPEKFVTLSRQFIELVCQDRQFLKTALSIVVAKSSNEEHMVEVYSRLCKALYAAAPASISRTIGPTLVELGRNIIYDFTSLSESLAEDSASLAKFQAKRLVCARFLSQLFVDDLLDCTQILELVDFFSQQCFGTLEFDTTTSFNLEILCKLLSHSGRRLDENWKDTVQPYYELLQEHLNTLTDTRCGRTRVLISNLLDLRTAQNWVPRREEDKPRPLTSS